MTDETNGSAPLTPPKRNSGIGPEQQPDLGKARKDAETKTGEQVVDSPGVTTRQLISKRTLLITGGGFLGMVLLCGICCGLLGMFGVGSGSVDPVHDGDGGRDTSDEWGSAAAKRAFLESVGRVEGKLLEKHAEYWLRQVEQGRWTWEDMDNTVNAYGLNSECRAAYKRWREAKEREAR